MTKTLTSFFAATFTLLTLLTVSPRDAAANPLGSAWTGCAIDVSASMLAATVPGDSSQIARAGVGLSCDKQFAKIVAGARLGLDHGRGQGFVTLGTRVGYLINPHLLGYGVLSYETGIDRALWSDGIVAFGVGIETFAFSDKTTLFFEASRDILQVGDARGLDSATSFRMGAKWRF
jgi:hypothetical protein